VVGVSKDYLLAEILFKDINDIFKVVLEYEEAGMRPVPEDIAHRLGLTVKRVQSLLKLMEVRDND
jgi:hypothetical protein